MAINMPQQQKSPIERIADGLSLVRNVYGIRADMTALDKAKREQEMAAQDDAVESPLVQSIRARGQKVGIQVPDQQSLTSLSRSKILESIENAEKLRMTGEESRKTEASKHRKETLDLGLKSASDLRKEYQGLPEIKAASTQLNAYKNIQKTANDPSAAGDLSLIFSYMKMLDPNSTVREGEFANAQNAAGVPTQIVQTYERIRSGQRLSPEQRDDFMKQASNIAQTAMESVQQKQGFYKNIAGQMRADPRLIFEEDQTFAGGPVQQSVAKKAPSGLVPNVNATGEEKFTARDLEALQWLKANPQDPMAKEIENQLRMKGLR